MIQKKMLFVDDRTKRIHSALQQYATDYDITIAANVKEALRAMIGEDFETVSLDHDLTGIDFEDPDTPTCGMEIVRYLEKTGWPPGKPKPVFRVHSSNTFAAHVMVSRLKDIGLSAEHIPFGWKRYQRGVVAGAFDLIHPGYVYLLEDAKNLCHHVTVLLHDKPDQVLDVSSRITILKALRFVDDVTVYRTEEELTALLLELKPDVRIIGSDHLNKTSRENLPFPTVYHDRWHDWSATKLKRMVTENYTQRVQT